MSSFGNIRNDVQTSGNVINNNGANNSGTGAGSQNFGQGAGAVNSGPGAGAVNSGPGAGTVNSGPGAGTVNSAHGAGTVNSAHGAGTVYSVPGSGTVNSGAGAGAGAGSSIAMGTGTVNAGAGGSINIGTGAGGQNLGRNSGSINYNLNNARRESASSKTMNSHDGSEGDNMFDGKAAPKEGESNLAETSKKPPIPSKDKMNVDEPTMRVKEVARSSKAVHGGQYSSVPAKLIEVDDFAMKLLNALSEKNEDRNVTVGRFGLMPTNDTCMVGKFKVHPMLEDWAHRLNSIPEFTSRCKANKMMIENAFVNLCAAMRHMEVTPFVDMDENFFYLCRDAIDDAESLNFEVGKIRARLLDLAKAYLSKGKFDMAVNLDEQIEEQAKHVENMKKFFAETNELVLKLEAGLKSIKAHLKSLSQEKERLSSSKDTELRQTGMEIAKNYGDGPGPFYC